MFDWDDAVDIFVQEASGRRFNTRVTVTEVVDDKGSLAPSRTDPNGAILRTNCDIRAFGHTSEMDCTAT